MDPIDRAIIRAENLHKNGGAKGLLEGMYGQMADDDYCADRIKDFFDMMLDLEDGSFIWHCTSGKDRTGVTGGLMLYALGALEIFDGIYDIDRVCVHIFQPRKSNVVSSMMDKTDLYQWADTELTEKAQLAYEGQGSFSCGEWCRFCKAKAECRERAEANLALARYEFQSPALLDDEEIADILGKVDALTAWASDVKEYALQQAISGKEWTGWKLVEGRSNRKYTSEAAVATTVEGAGFDPYERKVLGVTAMQKMLGKMRFEELLAPYIEKPQGKPTLVPESDKRPAMNTAKNDFMEEF